MTFIEIPPHLTPQPTRLTPLRELPPAKLVDDYASTDDLLRDTRDYIAALDFNVNIPAEHANADSVDGDPRMEPILEQVRYVTRKDLLIPPDECSSGGASSVETLPGGTLPETPSPSFAPDLMPAGDQAAPAPSPAPSTVPSEAAARRTARPTPHSEPACASARGKCTAAPTNMQWHRQPGGIFRATYTAQLALARSLLQLRDAGHCSTPRECAALRRVLLAYEVIWLSMAKEADAGRYYANPQQARECTR